MSGLCSNTFEDQEHSWKKEEYVENLVMKGQNLPGMQGIFLIQTDSSSITQVPICNAILIIRNMATDLQMLLNMGTNCDKVNALDFFVKWWHHLQSKILVS